jgi:predicted hydrocarbon binding protein
MQNKMTKCKTCKTKLNKTWNYCPKCGVKTKVVKDKFDSSGIKLERIKYLWERKHGGRVIYENFESVKAIGYIQVVKTIRQKLGNFSNMNFLNLRLFSFLYFKPDYLNELMKAYRSYGYYSAYFTIKDTKSEQYIGSDIDDERVWVNLFKRTIKYYTHVFRDSKTALPYELFADYKNKKFVVKLTETGSSLLKSKKPLCFFEIASICGPLEVMSNNYWVGEEVTCTAVGDEKCELVMYPSKTEDFENLPKFTSIDFKDLINQTIENIMRKENVKRKRLGNLLHIFDDQLLNYYLISLSTGHDILSKYAGCFVGESIIKKIGKEGIDNTLDYLIDLFEYLKVGLLQTESKTDDGIKLCLDESVYSSGVKNINMKLDTFIAGIIEGALNQATKRKWRVEETKCLARGNDHCEFNCKSTQH